MESLDNLWYVTIGHKIEALADLKRAKNEVHTAQYKDLIARKIHAIPEENLQEPPMSIVGPALEASKYYIEEEKLREMFSRVIATSMDSSKSENVHHSFVEIIKQLSPRDASNLTVFLNSSNIPCVKVIVKNKTTLQYQILRPLVFTPFMMPIKIEEADAASVSNLIRLGLITHHPDEVLAGDNTYDSYKHNNYFDSLKEGVDLTVDEFLVKNGSLRITPFGQQFINICLR